MHFGASECISERGGGWGSAPLRIPNPRRLGMGPTRLECGAAEMVHRLDHPAGVIPRSVGKKNAPRDSNLAPRRGRLERSLAVLDPDDQFQSRPRLIHRAHL